jgi:hypothetical protein
LAPHFGLKNRPKLNAFRCDFLKPISTHLTDVCPGFCGESGGVSASCQPGMSDTLDGMHAPSATLLAGHSGRWIRMRITDLGIEAGGKISERRQRHVRLPILDKISDRADQIFDRARLIGIEDLPVGPIIANRSVRPVPLDGQVGFDSTPRIDTTSRSAMPA